MKGFYSWLARFWFFRFDVQRDMKYSHFRSGNLCTFEHSDFNGSAIRANAVAPNAHVSACIRHPDVGDEQSTDVCAVHAGLEKTHRKVIKNTPLAAVRHCGSHFRGVTLQMLTRTTHISIKRHKAWDLPAPLPLETTQIWQCWRYDSAS